MPSLDTPPEKSLSRLDSYSIEQEENLNRADHFSLRNPDENVDVRLNNPLLGLTAEQIEHKVQDFVSSKGLEEYHDVFLKGAFCAQAQASGDYDSIPILTEDDRQILASEKEHRWHQPAMLYWLAICCSIAAAVQGADESVINGALLFFPNQFGLYTDYCDYFKAGPDGVCNGALKPEFADKGWNYDDVTQEIGKNNWLIGLPMNAFFGRLFPIYVREIGMGLSTAVFWFFNAILGITWFRLEQAFKPQGAFGWYAAWCAILWLLVFLFLPETKALTLEELDIVFNVPTTKHASYQIRQIPYFIKRYIFRKHVQKERLGTSNMNINKV
ncbi:hypothetical protein MCAP1_000028 [Malassezia caprae]|uniref:Uncharacterized protein n=1 Tax=Malassezia caprae TaxID=1381934 RepID=A0AAF0E458_9BASI|nr:hypothetical protein MCAP1_000028 [Malassezia caprae]